jgi:hypothetical protein
MQSDIMEFSTYRKLVYAESLKNLSSWIVYIQIIIFKELQIRIVK